MMLDVNEVYRRRDEEYQKKELTEEELRVAASKFGALIIFNESDLHEAAKQYDCTCFKRKERVHMKPCPVCGKKGTQIWYEGSNEFRKCSRCGFRGFEAEAGKDREIKKAWNRAVDLYVADHMERGE